MQCVAQAGGGRPGRWPPGSRPSGVQFSRCFRGHQRASQKSDGPPRNTSAVMLREAADGVKIPPTPAPHRKSKGNQEGFAFQPGWAGLSGLRVNLMIIMTSSQSWLEHSRVSEKGEVLKMFREGLRVSRVCAHSLDTHPVVLAGGRGWGGAGGCMLTGEAGCRRGAGSLTPLTPAQVRVPRAVGCPGPVGRFGKSSRIELGLEE